MSTAPLLPVEGLRVAYPKRDGGLQEVVRGVSFTLGRERLGIVGESGSGKSQTGRAIMGLTAPGAVVSAKTLRFDGESGLGIDLLTCPPQQRRALRGGRMAMVMQDPKFPLSPVMRIGAQIEETLRTHLPVSSSVRRARMLQALADVGIDDPARVARLYPDEEADASSNPPNPPSQTAQAAPPDSIDSVPDAPAVPARPGPQHPSAEGVAWPCSRLGASAWSCWAASAPGPGVHAWRRSRLAPSTRWLSFPSSPLPPRRETNCWKWAWLKAWSHACPTCRVQRCVRRARSGATLAPIRTRSAPRASCRRMVFGADGEPAVLRLEAARCNERAMRPLPLPAQPRG